MAEDRILEKLNIPCSHEDGRGKCDRVAGNIAFWASGKVTTRWTVKHGDKHPSDFDFPTVFRLLSAERPELLIDLMAEHAPALLSVMARSRPALLREIVEGVAA